ncbi:DUF3616 domain-containing protein [Gordonia sp. CPCC 205515]|uniref:DUF3616 domain-containing protein n=1 Tax=Gordonia sp. CPCC 205515 TaxID=3140791 RepID=UPI003AF3D26D
MASVSSIPFAEENHGTPYNASGVVPIGPRRFVFIDNRDPDAVFELSVTSDGRQDGPIVRRALTGVAPDALRDPEGLARIDTADGKFDLIVSSSFCARSGRKAHHTPSDGLVRIRYRPDGDLSAEAMPGFREWLLNAFPGLAPAARIVPDDDGLNVEGLAWDPVRQLLLFGLRSPVRAGRIPVLAVHLDVGAPWTTAACRAQSEVTVKTGHSHVPLGIRDMSYDPHRERFLLLLGRSTGGKKTRFHLAEWNGTDDTAVELDIRFTHRSMKPEGITAFSDGPAQRILIVDDAGGFAVFDAATKDAESGE